MKTNASMKKTNFSFMKVVVTLFFLLNIAVSFAQKSSTVELKVENDRNNRSTTSQGTYYKMTLSNATQSDVYELSATNVNAKSTNPDGSSVDSNVLLRIEFLDKNMQPIKELRVNSGETVKFFAHVVVPQGTAGDRWSSNKITAQSKSNSNYKVDTVLHTVVNYSTDN